MSVENDKNNKTPKPQILLEDSRDCENEIIEEDEIVESDLESMRIEDSSINEEEVDNKSC